MGGGGMRPSLSVRIAVRLANGSGAAALFSFIGGYRPPRSEFLPGGLRSFAFSLFSGGFDYFLWYIYVSEVLNYAVQIGSGLRLSKLFERDFHITLGYAYGFTLRLYALDLLHHQDLLYLTELILPADSAKMIQQMSKERLHEISNSRPASAKIRAGNESIP
jgi:hypothetical protein